MVVGNQVAIQRDSRKSSAKHGVTVAVRLSLIVAFLLLTNSGFLRAVASIIDQQRWVALVEFLGIWLFSFISILIVAFQPCLYIRTIWAAIIAFATAVGFSFRQLSGAEFGPFDAIALWNARHEAGRAMDFYISGIVWFVLVSVFGFLVMTMPLSLSGRRAPRWLSRLAWMPILPCALITAIVYLKNGVSSQGLPTQFAPISVAIVAGSKIITNPIATRSDVTWIWRGPFAATMPQRTRSLPSTMQMPTASAVRGIIVLVDESIRGDYIDWTPGNRYTPDLARLKDRIVDFGPTSSGSNCSDYSNAILRFAAAPNLLGSKLLSIPTIWQYAKKADFRTVFIDAQAAFNKTPGKLQNFMTREEILDIDRFYALDEHTPSYLLDDKLFEIITQELDASSDHAVFIYANKNGAHFPYDGDYPKSERLFHPTMSGIGIDNSVTRVNSYRNAIRWSVDRLFGRFFNATDLTNVVVIYTSDHGQAFNEGRLSHCTIERPDPREGLVPLFVVAGSDFLRARFTAAAESSRGHVSHFSITPTVLELMGYASGDMSALYGPSLFEKNSDKPAFTTGDIFGLFSTKILWHQIDLDGTYLESASASPLTQE